MKKSLGIEALSALNLEHQYFHKQVPFSKNNVGCSLSEDHLKAVLRVIDFGEIITSWSLVSHG